MKPILTLLTNFAFEQGRLYAEGKPLTGNVSDKENETIAQLETIVREARIDGMEQAKSRVLRRTEIPRDAKNPTRDVVVEIGEVCAEIIQQDIDNLKSKEG